ncbi:hypothetical protein C8J57DRAFT_1558576 [Mycena rebaudengoi]|nr:hypothetical protein C8J57DRAFT_1558576 [Mycena rebaudengoi]
MSASKLFQNFPNWESLAHPNDWNISIGCCARCGRDAAVPVGGHVRAGDAYVQHGIYIHPSALAVGVIGATVLGAQPLTPISPCADNCTYSIQFNAPSFSCIDSLQNASALPTAPPDYPAPNADTGKFFDSTPQQADDYSGWDFQLETVDYHQVPMGNLRDLTCVAYDSTYQVDYTFRGTGAPSAVPKVLRRDDKSLAQLGGDNGALLVEPETTRTP